MKKMIAFILSLIVALNVVCFDTHALSQNQIESIEADTEIIDYAHDVIKQHFYSVKDDVKSYGLDNIDLSSYKLGSYFTVYDVNNNSVIYEFALFSDDEIVGLLEVVKCDGELMSSFSKSFSNEINILLKKNDNMLYRLVTDGNKVYSVKKNNEINELYAIVKNDDNLSIKFDDVYNYTDNMILSTIDSLHTNMIEVCYSRGVRADVNKPLSYKTLNVKGVIQEGDTCWAATCAAIINYLWNENLTYLDVAKFIYPSNPNQGATENQTIIAYNHWYVYAMATSRISFSKIKSHINNNKPIHLRLSSSSDGHAVGLIGYEDWEDRDILILLEPNYGTRKTVTLNSSGNFNYTLSTINFSWYRTLEFL